MCGTCVFLYHSDKYQEEKLSFDFIDKHSRLPCRGPDKSHDTILQLSNGKRLFLSGHVLHFRGNHLVPQPATDATGNQLLWNGELYSGIDVPANQSDTTVLLELLSQDDSDENVYNTMSRIEGPWSFTYWQASTETLWFGRDVFGRRSLLWHLPESDSDPFILTSVRITPWHFLEVPSVGLYKMCLNDCQPEASNYKITVIPWKKAVWPGSLDIVENNEEFTQRLYPGKLASEIALSLDGEKSVDSHMPEVFRDLPPPDYNLPELGQNQSYLEYLENLSKTNSYLQTLSTQLTNVLLEAVRVRVFNQQKAGNMHEIKQPSKDSVHKFSDASPLTHTETQQMPGASCISHIESLVKPGGEDIPGERNNSTIAGDVQQSALTSNASIAILFSGGIDSTVLAALADRCLPSDEEIDLLNVAFEMKQKENPTSKKKRLVDLPPDRKWDVPDRQTGYIALSELNPNRKWNFVEVNVTAEELQEARQSCIEYLLHPLQTVLDDSIGCAVWFAARGAGVLGNGPFKGSQFISRAKVILCGMGADEQLVGYSRHRVRFKEEGMLGLLKEIQLEITRLSARNLGRDDRIITDHGKESRLPYLDENVVKFLSELPLHYKADLTLPRGLGEKLLLRLSAYELGLLKTSTLPKRAIQFGSRIAKMENSKEKASDTCGRLLNSQNDPL